MPGDYYVWTVDGKPVRVLLALSLVERLGAVAIEDFRISPDQPRDCFGALLGRSRREGLTTVVVAEDFEVMDAMPRSLDVVREQTVVGLFRGRAQGDLRLDARDAAQIERLFQRREHIYLLIQPQTGAPPRAGIFIQERGTIKGFATYREFPFHAGLLRGGGFPLSDGRPAWAGRAGVVAGLFGVIALGACGAYWMVRSHEPVPVAAAQPAIVQSVSPKPSPSEPPARAREAPRAKLARLSTTVAVEPIPPNRLRRLFGKLRRARFTPATAVKYPLPAVPSPLAARLHGDVPITLKLRVNKLGRVSDLAVLEASRQPELMHLAAEAAGQWRFTPARMNEHAVGSEVLARFRFHPVETP